MKSKMRLVVVLIVAIFIVSALFIFPKRTLEAPDFHMASSAPATDSFEPIAYTLKKDSIENGEVLITTTIPVVSGLKSPAINDAVNRTIEKVFSDSKNSFLQDTDGIKTISVEQKNQLTLEAGAPVSSREKTFYVEINAFSYYSGSAHPLSQKIVLNFVKETGQLIRLEDVLKKTSDGSALIGIARLAKPKIVSELSEMLHGNESTQRVDEVFEESGADAIDENYGTFYLKNNSIDWVFGQYQVAPYVFGEITISIPLNDLRPFLANREWLR